MEKSSTKKVNFKTIVIIIIIISVIIFGTLIFLCMLRFDDDVYNNVYLGKHDVSNMTPEELSLYVNSLEDELYNLNINILQNDSKIYLITPDMIDAKLDINATVKNVLAFGRNGNFMQNIISIFSAYNSPVKISPIIDYNEEKMTSLLKNVDLTLNDRVDYDTYLVDEELNKLVLIKGKDGYTIDEANLANNLIDRIINFSNEDIVLDLNLKTSNNLNANNILSDVKKDVRDAYIDQTTSPVTFVKEQIGIDIDEQTLNLKIQELNSVNVAEKIYVDLIVVKPNIYLEDIRYEMYNDKLSSYTTYFAGNKINRSKNIEIATKYINEKVIMPGEVFSFNENVGEITTEKGYLNAATFQGGKVVDGLGGGICQVSSTLYNAVLLSNLEIVERYAHSLPVSYVMPSRDATIYVGSLDLKFKNTRNYPIKIITSYSKAGNLTISIYGTKEEIEYDIQIESNVIKELDFSTQYVYDSNLIKGKKEVLSSGTNGRISEAYIVKKLNGKEVERKLLSRDSYSSVSEIVKVGTK